jgi:hypothetical protein
MSGRAMKAPGTFASLSSTLLARKGGARPAMRPNIGTSLDDLGWNDMGDDEPTVAATEESAPAYPEPLKYQEAIAEEFSAPAPTAEVVRLIKPVSRVTAKPELAVGKVAFTLRLDAERHLRLRLACAVSNRSAQKVVTDALDAFLTAHPEIEDLAGHVPSLKSDGRN